MNISTQKKFDKQYSKLDPLKKQKIDIALDKFIKDPFNSSLRNHSLKGSFKGFRSISADKDLRLIFKEYGGYSHILFLRVGNHRDAYRK